MRNKQVISICLGIRDINCFYRATTSALLVALFMLPHLLVAQPDCIMEYTVQAQVVRTSIPDSVTVTILVPDVKQLSGWERYQSLFDTIQVAGGEAEFAVTLPSYMGWYFCYNDAAVERVFRGKNKEYHIILQADQLQTEVFIPIDEIKFSYDDEKEVKVYIDLGRLEI